MMMPVSYDLQNIFLDERRAFAQKKLLCYELPTLTRDQEEDLLARVRMRMQLNNAEKLRASRETVARVCRSLRGGFSPCHRLEVA